MKKRFLIPAAGVFLAIGVIVFLTQKTTRPPESLHPPSDQLVLKTLTDPTLVFQKAFWRRPESDDKILHAERREWFEKGRRARVAVVSRCESQCQSLGMVANESVFSHSIDRAYHIQKGCAEAGLVSR
jgi:hypothetical protein